MLKVANFGFKLINSFSVSSRAIRRMPSASELVVCITSTALFDCSDSHEVWKHDGLEAYQAYQRARLTIPLKPGVGFPLVQSLLTLNEVGGKNFVDVILISRIDGDSGERLRQSIMHHNLSIRRMSFTAGTDVTKYLTAWKCDLFLSTEEEQVRAVLHNANSNTFEGIAAGLVYERKTEARSAELNSLSVDNEMMASKSIHIPVNPQQWPEGQVRIVFDGDGVLFSDEAECVFHEHGLVAFNLSEQDKGHIPLPKGPMHAFAMKLQNIRAALGANEKWRLCTFLVTARAKETTKRVYSTLKEWDLEIDEKHFLGGLDKTPFLRIIDPAIFFDDSSDHIERAKQHVPSAHVVYGTKNKQNTVSSVEPTPRLTTADDNESRDISKINDIK